MIWKIGMNLHPECVGRHRTINVIAGSMESAIEKAANKEFTDPLTKNRKFFMFPTSCKLMCCNEVT